MPEHYEAIVRLVHAAQRASIAYRARPLSPAALRRVLEVLVERGWVIRVRDTTAWRSNAAAWAITEDAVPHVLRSDRLPLHPGLSHRTHARRRPAARPDAAPTPPTYRTDYRTPWVAQAATPVRPGAMDFMACPSRTAFPARNP